jgi:hypothetical protein
MKCAFNECERNSKSKSYCDMHYRRLLKRGNVNDYGSKKVDIGNATERFNKKYQVQKNSCWLWTGGTRLNSKGVAYPRHWTDDLKSIGAHRFAYELAHGAIPKGMYVCHKCGFDNTSFYTSDPINQLLKGGRLNSNKGVNPDYLKMFLDL